GPGRWSGATRVGAGAAAHGIRIIGRYSSADERESLNLQAVVRVCRAYQNGRRASEIDPKTTANDGAVVELSGAPGKAQWRAEVIVIPINPVGENPGRLRSWVEHVRLG